MAVLEFNDTDYHNLIDLLVEAVKVTEATGQRPSVVIDGVAYAASVGSPSRTYALAK
jgi:hypothetical protein